jgi:hypothetical protein
MASYQDWWCVLIYIFRYDSTFSSYHFVLGHQLVFMQGFVAETFPHIGLAINPKEMIKLDKWVNIELEFAIIAALDRETGR